MTLPNNIDPLETTTINIAPMEVSEEARKGVSEERKGVRGDLFVGRSVGCIILWGRTRVGKPTSNSSGSTSCKPEIQTSTLLTLSTAIPVNIAFFGSYPSLIQKISKRHRNSCNVDCISCIPVRLALSVPVLLFRNGEYGGGEYVF